MSTIYSLVLTLGSCSWRPVSLGPRPLPRLPAHRVGLGLRYALPRAFRHTGWVWAHAPYAFRHIGWI